jgi:predicted kinase
MILLSAIPGSGKSTWARAFAADHPNTFIVSSDEIRKSLYGSVTNFQHEPEVWKTYLDTINNYADTMHDVTVIADATNLQNKYRIFYHDATPHFDKHILVLFKIPYESASFKTKCGPLTGSYRSQPWKSLRRNTKSRRRMSSSSTMKFKS